MYTPGPWEVGYRAMTVQGPSEKGGTFPICDIRGWGYLTGKGHGALGLEPSDAENIQTANARLIASAPDLLEMLKELVEAFDDEIMGQKRKEQAEIVIAVAEGRLPV